MAEERTDSEEATQTERPTRSDESKETEEAIEAGRRAPGALSARLRIDDSEGVLASGDRWLAEYLESADKSRLIVSLSGGLDSTVAVLWAARAVGAERLTILSLPCQTRMPGLDLGVEPVRRARVVAGMIPEADFRVLDIGPAVAAEAWTCGLTGALDASRWKGSYGLLFANLQARTRGIRLRTFANAQDALVLGTGNLSERLLGYFTVGGDQEADLEILGDLFKTHVRQIAPLLDVPEEIRTAEPSANLLPGQTDRRELGFTYEEADRVLAALVEAAGDRHVTDVPASLRERLEGGGVEGVRPNVIRRVLDRVAATAFKRARTPRFRSDRVEPVAG